jgi:glycerol uptake facilitator-like aquaporin
MSSSRIAINPSDTISPDIMPNIVVTGTNNGFKQPPPLSVRMLCELVGTCLFIVFGAGCAVKPVSLLTVAAAHGLVTMWLVYVFGPVSGGHFNAGATVAFAVNGKMKIIEIIGYLFAQGIGSLLAGVLLLALYGTGTSLATPALKPDVTVMQGFAIEFICTSVLSFVIFFTTSYNTHKEAAFPIGLVVLSSFLIGADRDGAALNPWRWFGPAVISNTYHSEAWIYVAGPILGFLYGYILFRLYKGLWNRRTNREV